MNEREAVNFLEAFLKGKLPDWAESRAGVQATAVTCIDGRLNQFLRPFRHVIRTAGAVTEPVEGAVELASQATDVLLLIGHGDCLSYRAAIEYLSSSWTGMRRDDRLAQNLNRSDTRALLRHVNNQWPLNALPDPNDQKALARLAITYAISWTSASRVDRPRVGLFLDLKSVLSSPAQAWCVSYGRLSGQDLRHYLSNRGMSPDTVAAQVLVK